MNAIKTVSVHELKSLLDKQSVVLIDVRELDEWQAMHIPQAWHLPKEQIAQVSDKISDKDTAIYLHCKSGVRSLDAANRLQQLGYTNVYSIAGGIVDWIQAGFKVDTGMAAELITSH